MKLTLLVSTLCIGILGRRLILAKTVIRTILNIIGNKRLFHHRNILLRLLLLLLILLSYL